MTFKYQCVEFQANLAEAVVSCMNLNMSLIALGNLQTLSTYIGIFSKGGEPSKYKLCGYVIVRFITKQQLAFGPQAATKAAFAMWSGRTLGALLALSCRKRMQAKQKTGLTSSTLPRLLRSGASC